MDRPAPVAVTVTDLAGNVVWQQRGNAQAVSSMALQIPTHELAAGAYLLKVQAGEYQSSRKLMVTH